MKVRMYTRISTGAKRRYVPVNNNKLCRDGTVFCLRHARRWETLTAANLSAALAARALKEAALLTQESSPAVAPKSIGTDDAISVYLRNTAATKKHRTLLAYTLATGEFRKRTPWSDGTQRVRPRLLLKWAPWLS
jgi:hypothetical protein